MLQRSPQSTETLVQLRDHLAESFAEQVAGLAPLACDELKARYNKTAPLDEKAILREAARVVHGNAQVLRDAVAQEFRTRYDAKLNAPDDALSHTGRFSLDALKLMEHLGMHEEFELEQSVGQLRRACEREIAALEKHLTRLVGRSALPESHNPVFPRVFARSLQDALSAAGCDPAAKRAAFRAFLPFMKETLPALYAQAESMLALGGRKPAAEFKVPGKTAARGVESVAA